MANRSAGAYRVRRALLTLLLVLGLAVMAYPAAQRVWFAYQSGVRAQEYEQAVRQREAEDLGQAWEDACAYNAAHRQNVVMDAFVPSAQSSALAEEYVALLNPLGTGEMGYLDIPRIGQRLNIYHGTDAGALERGVGHLMGTSLPVGGASSRCVLAGHRGLPAAKLFTDLDQLRPGDVVYLHVLDRVLAYEVDGSQVVLPTDLSVLDIVPGEDLLTLVTCTPYSVNTHRLLVTCHAVPYVESDDITQNVAFMVKARLMLMLAAVAVGVSLVFMAASQLVRVRREQARPHGRHER